MALVLICIHWYSLPVPDIVLGTPVKKTMQLTTQLLNLMTRYFGVVYNGLSATQFHARIDAESIIHYGCLCMAGVGDNVQTADLITQDPNAHHNSYLRVSPPVLFVLQIVSMQLPPNSVSCHQMPMLPTKTELTFPIGNLDMANCSTFTMSNLLKSKWPTDTIYHATLHSWDSSHGTHTRYLLTLVKPCNTHGLDAAKPQTTLVKYTQMLGSQLIDIHTIKAVTGRTKLDNGWAIINRNRNGACTLFIDSKENDLEGLPMCSTTLIVKF